jgi:Holliday junction resolvase RusA-like endonuclease
MKTSVTPSGKSKELIDALTNAAYYKGDSNVLKIAPEDKKSYVQLGHYSK